MILCLVLLFVFATSNHSAAPIPAEKAAYYQELELAKRALENGQNLTAQQEAILKGERLLPNRGNLGELDHFGGPDEFWYVFLDDDEPGGPVYNWIDITGNGTVINNMGNNQAMGPFPLPFTFPFYENEYEEVYISSNGFLTFGEGNTTSVNRSIPDPTFPNNAIYFLWDDLNPTGDSIYYGEDEEGNWVCTFEDVDFFGQGGPATFQVILFENGEILMQYAVMSDRHNSETIGIENSDGTIGLMASLNNTPANYPTAQTALLFCHMTPIITVDPEALTFNVPWNGQDSDILTIGNAGGVDLEFSMHVTYIEEELMAGRNASEVLTSIVQTWDSADLGPSTHDIGMVIPSEPSYSELDEPYYVIFQDNFAWGQAIIEPALNALEVPYDVVGSNDFATREMDDYTVMATTSCQPQTYYNLFQASHDRFEEWVDDGGWLEFHGCTQGPTWSLWDGTTYVHQGSGTNTNILPDHPLMAGIGQTITGNSANHGYLSNLPEDAVVIMVDPSQRAVLIETEYGRGNIIATGQTWEFYWGQQGTCGPIMANCLAYCIANAEGGGWLLVEPNEGVVEPDHTMDLEVIVDASVEELLEGIYEALIEIESNDPENEVMNVWVTLIVGSPGVLQGTVTNSETNEPVENAEVIVYDENGEFFRSVFTNEVGFYTMSLGESEWDISARAENYYDSDIITVTIIVGETTTQDIELDHEVAPEITIDPLELRFIAQPLGSDSDVMTITNTGGLPLDFRLGITYIEEEEFITQVIENNGMPNRMNRSESLNPIFRNTNRVVPTLTFPTQKMLMDVPQQKRDLYNNLKIAYDLYQNHKPLNLKQRNLLSGAGVIPPLDELDRTGGPDGFGYYFFDSDEDNGPVYEWVDITQTGTQIVGMGDDDYEGPLPLPFDFPFYENVYNSVFIGSNGYLSFGQGYTACSNSAIPTPPDGYYPNNAIYFFWDDFYPPGGGQIWYGEDANGNWVCSFINVQLLGRPSNTVQVILYPDGNILTQYQAMGDNTSETIGLENANGTIALQASLNADPAGYPPNESAIGFTLNENGFFGGWLEADPTSGHLEVEEEIAIDLIADAAPDSMPEGIYEAMLEVSSQEGWWGVETETAWATFIVGAGGIFNPVPPTGLPYPIIIEEALVDNEPIDIASGIGVFDGDLCVGAITVDGEWPRSLIAWEGDPERQVDGFTAGHQMSFRFWTSGDQQEMDARATYIRGNGTFGNGGYSHVRLNAGGPPALVIPLARNYFELTSTHLIPDNLNASVVFGGIANLAIVYQDNGGIFIPPNINTIGNITITEGYQIFCREVSSLTIEGQQMDYDTPYDLHQRRWNWLGYPFPIGVPIMTALSPIMNNIIIVQTDDGRLLLPPWINNIVNMAPGEGYFIFVNQDVVFVYNQGVMAAAVECGIQEVPEVEGAPSPTGLPYAVIVKFTETVKAMNPSTVEIYDGNLLVGKAVVLQEMTPVIAWGGSAEHNVEGFTPGNPMTLVVRTQDGSSLPIRVVSDELPLFGTVPYADLTLDLLSLPSEFTVSQGYPNPFNPTVTVPFALPERGEVSFAVFNILGQKVFQSVQNLEAGYHQFVFEANRVETDLVSGMYFLQVEFAGQVQNQKLMLLK